MIRAEPAFAGVVRELALLRAAIERPDGIRAERPEAHCRDVEDGCAVGRCAIGAADRDPERRNRVRPRRNGMAHPFVAVSIYVILRAERSLIEDVLGALIDDRALVPAERQAVLLILEKILAHLWPYFFQHESKMRRNRIIAQHRVSRLNEIDCAEHCQAGKDRNRNEEKRNQPRLPHGKPEQQESAGDRCGVNDESRRERQEQDVHGSHPT